MKRDERRPMLDAQHTLRASSFARSACAAWICGLLIVAAGTAGCALTRVDAVIGVPVQPSPVPSPPPIFKLDKITRYEQTSVRWIFINADGKEAAVELNFPDLIFSEARAACFSASVSLDFPKLTEVNGDLQK